MIYLHVVFMVDMEWIWCIIMQTFLDRRSMQVVQSLNANEQPEMWTTFVLVHLCAVGFNMFACNAD